MATMLKEEKIDIFCINIRSFPKHKEDLLCDIYAKVAECICLTEIWSVQEDFPGYESEDKVCYSAPMGTRGKGCCAIVPSNCKLVKSLAEESFQLVSYIYKKEVQITVTYVSKDPDFNSLRDNFQKMLDPSLRQCVIGDFNFHSTEKNLLTDYFKLINLSQIVKEPTHDLGGTIDHCYVSRILKENIELNCMFKYYSDHTALQIKLNI